MSLTERIQNDMKEAMKAKDQAALRTTRAIKSAILLEQTSEGGSKELNEEQEIKLLTKLVKQRRDSLSTYEEQGREDLAAKEREEIEVIERYLPEQLGEEELRVAIQKIVTGLGAEGIKDMGKVMGVASKEFAGKADGKMVADIVKSILS